MKTSNKILSTAFAAYLLFTAGNSAAILKEYKRAEASGKALITQLEKTSITFSRSKATITSKPVGDEKVRKRSVSGAHSIQRPRPYAFAAIRSTFRERRTATSHYPT